MTKSPSCGGPRPLFRAARVTSDGRVALTMIASELGASSPGGLVLVLSATVLIAVCGGLYVARSTRTSAVDASASAVQAPEAGPARAATPPPASTVAPTPSASAVNSRLVAGAANAANAAGPEGGGTSSARPADPTVAFECSGAAEICEPLRTAIQGALAREGLSMTRGRPDIAITAQASILDDRGDRQFETTMLIRTYSLPAVFTFNGDAGDGADCFEEHARTAAAGTSERLRAYWQKRVR